MVLERKNFIIESDENIPYILDVVDYLETKSNEIMDFFGLTKINKKRIVVYNNVESYKKHIEQFFEYYDYMCADTNDGNINILSLDAAHQTKMYSDMDISQLKSTILHEFVHICQQESELEHIDEDIIWFWECLATNLGNPEKYECVSISASNEDINNFNCSKDNYPIAFTIGKYMLENYSHEEILEYIKYPSRLLADSERILNEAREWSNKKRMI